MGMFDVILKTTTDKWHLNFSDTFFISFGEHGICGTSTEDAHTVTCDVSILICDGAKLHDPSVSTILSNAFDKLIREIVTNVHLYVNLSQKMPANRYDSLAHIGTYLPL